MRQPQNYTLYLRYIEFQEKCPFILENIQKEYHDYFFLRDQFHVLMNHFFYKKLKGHNISVKRMLKRWKQDLPNEFKDNHINLKLMEYLKNMMFLFETNLDIKCISSPINVDISGIKLNGNIDLVTKEDNKYNVYFFIMDDGMCNTRYLENVLPGLLSVSFYYDFREMNFDVILYNITNRSSYVIKDAGVNMSQLFDKTQRVLNRSYNCSACILKPKCTYETEHNNGSCIRGFEKIPIQHVSTGSSDPLP